MTQRTAMEEWRSTWTLPATALLGVACSGALPYSTGVFMGELTREFGWTKAQYTSAMSAQLLMMLVLLPLVGRAIDRFGPRRVALAGMIPGLGGTCVMALANGEMWQWWLLHALQSMGIALLVPPVWLTAVAGRFHASRGLAIAVTLSGIGAGTALWPILAAFYIELFGWRLAYCAMGLTWLVALLPMTLFFFQGSVGPGGSSTKSAHGTPPLRQALLSPTFLLLATAAGVSVLASYAMIVHLVPILRDQGLGLTTAAAVAGVTGVCSITGRLVTGFLLDRMPTKPFGVVAFLLPAAAAIVILLSGGAIPLLLLGAALLGLAMGAESDIIAFVNAQRFDHGLFGSLASVIQTITAVMALAGAMGAGWLADRGDGSYYMFLLVVVPVAAISALCILLLPAARNVPEGVPLQAQPVPQPAE